MKAEHETPPGMLTETQAILRFVNEIHAMVKDIKLVVAAGEQPPDEDVTLEQRVCCQCGHGFSENEVYYTRELCAKCFGRCQKCVAAKPVRALKPGYVEYSGSIWEVETALDNKLLIGRSGLVGSPEVDKCYEPVKGCLNVMVESAVADFKPQADAPLGATRAERIALYRTAGMIVEEEGDAPKCGY